MMIGNTSFAFLVSLAASLCLVESMMTPAANETVVPASSPCESRIIGECNQKFKNVFARAKRNGRGTKEGSTPEVLTSDYCEAIQIFMDCLAKQSYCRGAWIDDYRYVVLEHGMMDKKCGKCPYHNYDKLNKLLSPDTRQDYVGYDTCSTCASRIHGNCVDRFLKQLVRSDNMCDDIQTFISCYLNEKNKCGDDRIVNHFVSLCDKLGEKMLHADRSHPGSMC